MLSRLDDLACAKWPWGLEQYHSIVERSKATPEVSAHEQNDHTMMRSTDCSIV